MAQHHVDSQLKRNLQAITVEIWSKNQKSKNLQDRHPTLQSQFAVKSIFTIWQEVAGVEINCQEVESFPFEAKFRSLETQPNPGQN